MLNRQERDNLLALAPAHERGELSPSEAHRFSLALQEDPEFAQEAERELVIAAALSEMDPPPMPKGMVANAVTVATGEEATQGSWFSLDSLLIALGVGVLCAVVAQFLAGKLLRPETTDWAMWLISVATEHSSLLVAGAVISLTIILGGGAWLAFRMIRT